MPLASYRLRLLPAFALWLAVGVLAMRASLLAWNGGRAQIGPFGLHCALIVIVMAVPGPLLLVSGPVSGARSLIVRVAVGVGLVGCSVVAAAVSVAIASDVGPIHWPALWAANHKALESALLAASGLALVVAAVAARRSVCPACRRSVKLWHSHGRCSRHGAESTFHRGCLTAAPTGALSASEDDAIAALVALARGDRDSAKGGVGLAGDDVVCGACARKAAIDALFIHSLHGRFCVAPASLKQREILCEHCHQPGALSPTDERPIRISLLEGSAETEVPAHALGPLVACPQCGTTHHLLCWRAHGGCQNAGRRDGAGNTCFMSTTANARRRLFNVGWTSLCTECVRLAGWTIDGRDHGEVQARIRPSGGAA